MSLNELQSKLGYEFGQQTLLTQALTHRSFGQPNNERFEFLGDSILNCVVASMLFDQYGKLDEGDLSRLRSNLVKQQTLYEIAQNLSLGTIMKMGRFRCCSQSH
jgi:ribonuclease III